MANDIGSMANELVQIQSEVLNLDGLLQQLGNNVAEAVNEKLSNAATLFTEMVLSMQTDSETLEGLTIEIKEKMSSIWDTEGILNFSDAVSGVSDVIDVMKSKIDESGSSLIEYLGNIDAATIGTWAQEGAINALNAAENGLNTLLGEGAGKWVEDTTNMSLDTAEAWLHEEATDALNTVKGTLNDAIDNTIGKLVEETGLFGESETALKLQETAVDVLNTAKEKLNELIDDTIGGLIDEGIQLVISTAKTWLQEAAQAALNFVLNLNPIALIVIAIAALVAGFILLWNKCEGFREFMTGFFKVIANAFIGFVNLLISGINMLMNIVLTPINLIIKALNIIPGVNIPQLSVSIPAIPSFADGGIPGYGELFVAREAGPEFVGAFGSRNVVMNNDQIVTAVSGGVYDAVRRANAEQSRQPIYLNVEAKVRENVLFDLIETVKAERGVRLSTGGAW